MDDGWWQRDGGVTRGEVQGVGGGASVESGLTKGQAGRDVSIRRGGGMMRCTLTRLVTGIA